MAKNIGSLSVPCTHCGEPVKRSPSTLAKANGRAFCGAGCYQAHRRGRPAETVRRDKGIRTSTYVERPCATCGTPVARRASDTRARSFCSRACYGKSVAGSGRGRPVMSEIGTRRVGSEGYVLVFVGRDNPSASASSQGWVLEHRLVMAAHLGRPLLRTENVHHRNGVRDDNRLENLELWVTDQPKGQRVDEVVAWAHMILDRYEGASR